MSVTRCHTCKLPFWRYRGVFPPGAYCSWACWRDRTRRKPKIKPETAAAVLEAFREHRLTIHDTRDLSQWFDCDVCERFEERYAVSMYL